MVNNLNGTLYKTSELKIPVTNRAFNFGDCVFETIRVLNNNVFFWEEHYFNLMASMRIFRMNIPLEFTPFFFLEEIKKTLEGNKFSDAIIRFMVYREGNRVSISHSNVSFLITTKETQPNWLWFTLEIDIFKDYTVNPSFYAQVNCPKPEEVIAQVYQEENDYQDIILLNSNKRIARSLQGSIFIIKGREIKTPKMEEGVIRSVLRNLLIQKIHSSNEFEIIETEIQPFEIQQSDEVFICIDGEGISSISKSRKKEFGRENTSKIATLLETINV